MRIFLAAILLAVLALLYRSFLVLTVFQTFAVTVVSLVLEALPFLLLGALAAAIVRETVPVGALHTVSRRMGVFGIPLVALSGVVAPVCECAIVPTVAGLRERGLSTAYAITLIVSVPLLNPIVLVSTLAAFPGRPQLVVARFLGGFLVAVTTGVVFSVFGRATGTEGAASGTDRATDPADPGTNAVGHGNASTAIPVLSPERLRTSWFRRLSRITVQALTEFTEIFGYFLMGAVASALVQVAVPVELYGRVGSSPMIAVLLMMAAAYLLSVCSEADAFIGKAFLPLMGSAGVTAFLIFGPMLDLKNTVMLRRTFSVAHIIGLAAVLLIMVPLAVFALHLGGFL